MDNVVVLEKNSIIKLPLLTCTLNILFRGGDDADDDAFHSEDCGFLWLVQEAPCFIPRDYVVKEFVVFIRHMDDVTGNVHSRFFLFGRQPSMYQMVTKAAHVQHIMRNTVTTSYRNFQPVMKFGSQISYCHISQPRTYSTFASFVDVDGSPLRGSSSMVSRPSCERLCQSYT
jgi:hypothetical protein